MLFRFFIVLLSVLFIGNLHAQQTVYVPTDNHYGGTSQESVHISTHVNFPDVKVLLARDIPFEDLALLN